MEARPAGHIACLLRHRPLARLSGCELSRRPGGRGGGLSLSLLLVLATQRPLPREHRSAPGRPPRVSARSWPGRRGVPHPAFRAQASISAVCVLGSGSAGSSRFTRTTLLALIILTPPHSVESGALSCSAFEVVMMLNFAKVRTWRNGLACGSQ